MSTAIDERVLAERELEHWWAEDIPCQSSHADPRNLECSGEVTHVHSLCLGQRLVCAKAATYVEFVLSGDQTWRCLYCRDRCRSHWRIIPV